MSVYIDYNGRSRPMSGGVVYIEANKPARGIAPGIEPIIAKDR